MEEVRVACPAIFDLVCKQRCGRNPHGRSLLYVLAYASILTSAKFQLPGVGSNRRRFVVNLGLHQVQCPLVSQYKPKSTMSGRHEKKLQCFLLLCSTLVVCSVIGAVFSILSSQADLQSVMQKMAWVGSQPRPAPKTITFKRFRRDGFLETISIELDSMIVVEITEPGRSLQTFVPFNEPAPEVDDDAGLRFYRKTLPTPIYIRKDFQRKLLSYAPRDEPPPAAMTRNEGFGNETLGEMLPTILVGIFSAIIGCGVVLSALRLKRCVFLSMSDQEWSASNETSTRLSRLFRKPPLLMSGRDTASSILDMSLYGTSKGESVSPISSAIMMSSSMEGDDEVEDPAQQRERGTQEILRPSDTSNKEGYVFVLRSTKTESTASDSSPSSTESRDDVESTQDFLHDIFIVRPDNPLDLGIVIADPLCPSAHPSVAFVQKHSVLAGRIGEGDTIISVNNSDVVGKNADIILHLIERGLNDDVTSIKITVMSCKQPDNCPIINVHDFTGAYPSLSIGV